MELAWVGMLASLRVSTSSLTLQRSLSMPDAAAIVTEWLNRPVVNVVHPGKRHGEIMMNLLVEAQASGRRVTDAHLAALAIEHGATPCSAHWDFTRFPGLRLLNPLKLPLRKR